jgi:hypothetical protein
MDDPSFCCLVVDDNHDDVSIKACESVIKSLVLRCLELGRQGRKSIKLPLSTLYFIQRQGIFEKRI